MISCGVCNEEIGPDEELSYYEGKVFHKDCEEKVTQDNE